MGKSTISMAIFHSYVMLVYQAEHSPTVFSHIPYPHIFLSLFKLLVVLIEVLFVLRNHCLQKGRAAKNKGDTMSVPSNLRMSTSMEGYTKQNMRTGIHKRKFAEFVGLQPCNFRGATWYKLQNDKHLRLDFEHGTSCCRPKNHFSTSEFAEKSLDGVL